MTISKSRTTRTSAASPAVRCLSSYRLWNSRIGEIRQFVVPGGAGDPIRSPDQNYVEASAAGLPHQLVSAAEGQNMTDVLHHVAIRGSLAVSNAGRMYREV
jgi:hypothetical protein